VRFVAGGALEVHRRMVRKCFPLEFHRAGYKLDKDMDASLWERKYHMFERIPLDSAVGVQGLEQVIEEEKAASKLPENFAVQDILLDRFVAVLRSSVFFGSLFSSNAAAELPLVRIAHGAFNEKVEALWIGVEQGFFRKHGVNVERLLAMTNPKVKDIKAENAVDERPVQRVEMTIFYRELGSKAKKATTRSGRTAPAKFCIRRGENGATQSHRMAGQGKDLRDLHRAVGGVAGKFRHARVSSAPF